MNHVQVSDAALDGVSDFTTQKDLAMSLHDALHVEFENSSQ
jgi:hypothetical protein